MPDRISWYIADKPVQMGGWSADMNAHGGFRDFRGTAVGTLLYAEQEAPVAGYRRDGSVFWYGTMVTDPEITEAGSAINAEGLYKGDFATKAGRVFYLSRSLGIWGDAAEEPYMFLPSSGKTYSQSVTDSALVWTIDKSDDTIVGDETGWAAWIDGTTLTNLSFVHTLMLGATNPTHQNLRIATGDGPTGPTTQEGAVIAVTTTPVDRALTETGGDLVRIRIVRTNVAASSGKAEGYISNIELRGLAPTSTYTVEQVMTDILSLDNRAPLVAPSSLDVMPLDFTGTAYDLASYVTRLADWFFMIEQTDRYGTLSRAGPWEEVISVARKRNARTGLQPLRRYNQVRVPYKLINGVEAFAIVRADPDPFPSRTVEFLAEALEDPQSDSTVADAIAATLVKRYSAIRRSGNVLLSEARAGGRTMSPYEVRPGVMVDLADHDPYLPPQRIESVTWNAEAQVQVAIDSEATASSTLKASASATPGPRNRNA